jgi:hypothetical protein
LYVSGLLSATASGLGRVYRVDGFRDGGFMSEATRAGGLWLKHVTD